MSAGPKTITIPARSISTCIGCTYYERELIRSGSDPLYAHNCLHPGLDSGHNFRGRFQGNLGDPESSGHIKTPDWCPVTAVKGYQEPARSMPAVCKNCGQTINPDVETLPGHQQSCKGPIEL